MKPGKYGIYVYFLKNRTNQQKADYLKNAYGFVALKIPCDFSPVKIRLRSAGKVAPLPHMEHVLVGFISYTPAVLQRDFRVLIVEYPFDILRFLSGNYGNRD